jgi:CHASE2 domain-containing sensor protein
VSTPEKEDAQSQQSEQPPDTDRNGHTRQADLGEPPQQPQGGQPSSGASTTLQHETSPKNKASPSPGRQVTFAIITLLVLFGIQLGLEETRLADEAKTYVYNLLEGFLPDTTLDRLPVMVLDITKLKGGTKELPTDREELKRIVEALAASGASVVGIDVDLSPAGVWFRNAADPAYFQHWKDLSVTTPVFIGMYENREADPEHWLGSRDFQQQAAFLGMASSPDGTPKLRMTRFYERPDGKGAPTMGYLLAKAYREKHRLSDFPDVKPWLAPFIDVEGSKNGRLVNYSKLYQMVREYSSAIGTDAISQDARYYRDKIVVIGKAELNDAVRMRDSFFTPSNERQPGAFYQACAAYTFGFEPLYEFNKLFRIVLDLGLGSIFVLAVCLRSQFVKGHRLGLSKGMRFIEQYAFLLAIFFLVVIALGALFVLNVMWLDSIVVAFGVLLHYVLPQQVKELFPSLLGEKRKE